MSCMRVLIKIYLFHVYMTVLFIEKKPLKKLCEFARSSLKINLKCIHNEYAVYVYV